MNRNKVLGVSSKYEFGRWEHDDAAKMKPPVSVQHLPLLNSNLQPARQG